MDTIASAERLKPKPNDSLEPVVNTDSRLCVFETIHGCESVFLIEEMSLASVQPSKTLVTDVHCI